MRISPPLLALAAAACSLAPVAPLHAAPPAGARLEILTVEGRTLRDNPLGDPAERQVAIFLPADAGTAPLPIVYYLPGYGGSSADYIAQGEHAPFLTVVAELAAAGHPLIIAVPDARNRFGGSQYLNSPAQGNYLDYLTGEIREAVEKAHPVQAGARIIAGHSSGGYGSLILGMKRHDLYPAIVALAPDSDFEATHKEFVQKPQIRAVTPAEVDAYFGPAKTAPRPADGAVELTLGLSAAYAPAPQPGRVNWLYDDAGQWQPQVWQQWLEHDSLLLIRAKADAFAPTQRIYLEATDHDDWHFNESAHRIYEVLKARGADVSWTEPPGRHSDNVPARLAAGLRWVLARPLP